MPSAYHRLTRTITIHGDLTDAQCQRLLDIADLSGDLEVDIENDRAELESANRELEGKQTQVKQDRDEKLLQ